MRRRTFLLHLGATLAPSAVSAQGWPQMLGTTRDGSYRGAPLADRWPSAGPRVVWRKTIGQGLSGPIVVGDRLVLFHRVANEEIVEAFDRRTGQAQWRYAYPTTYRDDFGFDEGPRAVPVAAEGTIFTFGAQGQLHAVQADKGTRVWSLDTAAKFSVAKGFFGAAGSPLVEEGRVIANIGGRGAGIVAFDAKRGTVLWTATDDEASYSSPVGATLDGKRVAVFLTRAAVVGVESATGRVVFRRPWRARIAASVNAATPVVVGDLVFVSAEYGPGAGVLRMTGPTLEEVWSSNDVLSNHYATSVHADGVLYGFHGRQEFGPSLRAVELRTGKVRWSEERFRAGSVLLAGNHLLIAREGGELVLAQASPDAFRPLARAQVLSPTVRALPALSDGLLYLRNDNTLICLDVGGA